MLTRFEPPLLDYTPKADLIADAETRKKFFALDNVFWIRLFDLMDIVPRYPHLGGLELKLRPVALNSTFPPSPATSNDASPTLTNGNLPTISGALTNGYH